MSFETESALLPNAEQKSTVIGLHPLQQAAARLTDYRDGRSRVRAKDLVGMLLCHGARAWRASQPRSNTRLVVRSASGNPAVRIAFGRSI
ncbi:hypothetical protein [Aureimonas sp. Leaf324]|jgi:hypothetical protein|uniref:hypothetical protein n=1 Tax=Aureimonas sp. Leaf324 TaxID=1736336 RepID=UPI0006F83035|nr:hypothetical protein [Aureimonas sp. Leaf324]KQQ89835.1 hypothetical protein ASF65_16355 [Aureimonas sp. Leaf324]